MACPTNPSPPTTNQPTLQADLGIKLLAQLQQRPTAGHAPTFALLPKLVAVTREERWGGGGGGGGGGPVDTLDADPAKVLARLTRALECTPPGLDGLVGSWLRLGSGLQSGSAAAGAAGWLAMARPVGWGEMGGVTGQLQAVPPTHSARASPAGSEASAPRSMPTSAASPSPCRACPQLSRQCAHEPALRPALERLLARLQGLGRLGGVGGLVVSAGRGCWVGWQEGGVGAARTRAPACRLSHASLAPPSQAAPRGVARPSCSDLQRAASAEAAPAPPERLPARPSQAPSHSARPRPLLPQAEAVAAADLAFPPQADWALPRPESLEPPSEAPCAEDAQCALLATWAGVRERTAGLRLRRPAQARAAWPAHPGSPRPTRTTLQTFATLRPVPYPSSPPARSPQPAGRARAAGGGRAGVRDCRRELPRPAPAAQRPARRPPSGCPAGAAGRGRGSGGATRWRRRRRGCRREPGRCGAAHWQHLPTSRVLEVDVGLHGHLRE